MRTWLAPALLAVTVLWGWWVRRRLRARSLETLVRAADGSVARARTVTVAWQSGLLLVGVLLMAAAMLADVRWDAPVVRVLLLLVVLAVVVPLGGIASGRDASRGGTRRVQVRRSVQERLGEAGASPQVAQAVVAASRPFSYLSFLLGVLAAVLLVWHDLG